MLNRRNNCQISIETSAPQQAVGFIIKHYIGISNIGACRWLTDKQSMSNHVSLCQGIRFSIGFPLTISKPQILNWVQLESLETINKLCTLYLSSKPHTSSSPVAIVKSHGKKCQNYFRVTTSPFAKMWLDEMLRKKGIKKKMMNFDY